MVRPVVDLDAVADRAAFAAALTRQREAADRSVRDVARTAGQRASTLGGWFSGRNLPQRTQRPAFRAVLQACAVDPDDVDAWVEALERVRGTPAPAAPSRPDVAPYRGLQSFEASDAAWFFGREPLTALLLDRVATLASAPEPRVLAVVGPSGSGKSSVLRAGLVPAVARDGVPGDARRWAAEVMVPGEDPRGAWASRPSAGAARVDGVATLLVVDQFEELFAASVDDTDRAAFLDDLFDAATAGDLVVVLGLRADFYAAAVADPRLARVLQDGQVVVPPMGERELRAAIVEPARQVGGEVDADLVERLLREMGVTRSGGTHDSGALPLLSHALRATWDLAARGRLTMADYDATGGIAGSIEQTAEEVHEALDDRGRALARTLITRLVRVDDTSGVLTRRPLDRADLPGDDPVATTEVLDAFVEHRLLTADARTVGISHERLLTAWPRVAEWIEADRDVLRARHQLADAVRAWQTHDRDRSYLLTGTRLAAATELAAVDGPAWSVAERDLLAASVDAAQDERRRQRRRLRRTRQLLALVAVLAVVASAAGIVALRARGTADQARRDVESTARETLSRQVAVEARAVAAKDPALAQQLAVAAWRTSPTSEARGALLDLTADPVVSRVLGPTGPTPLAVSPDGTVLAVGHGDDGSVHLYRLRDGRAPSAFAVIPGASGRQVYALAWHGSVLAVGGTTRTVSLYDLAGGRPVALAELGPAFGADLQSIAFSPDGRLIAAASGGADPVRVWDVSTPANPRFLAAPPGVPDRTTEQAVTFSRDGATLVAGGTGGSVFAWSTASLTSAPSRTVQADTATVNAVAYDPAGTSLYTGDRLGIVRVLDGSSFAVTSTHQLATAGYVNVLAFSPDGGEIAVGDSDGGVERFATSPWTARQSTGNPGPVTGVAYTPDGRSLASAAADGTVRVWSAAQDVSVGFRLSVFALTWSASGDDLALSTSGADAAARVWDTTDPRRPVPASPALQAAGMLGSGALAPDGRTLATGSLDGTVRLWDTRDPAAATPVGAGFAGAGALVEWLGFSPDGRTLAVGSDDETLRLWDVRDPAAPAPLGVLSTKGFVLGGAWSPDGTRVAAASADGQAYVWDVADPTRPAPLATLDGFTSYVYGVAFSPDGRRLAATGADRSTKVWDLGADGTARTLLATLTGPKGYDVAVAFSPDGRQLAVASNDENVWLWDVSGSAARSLGTLQAVGGPVDALAWSPDGRHLAAGGRSTRVPVWGTDPDAAVAAVCAAAGDRITAAEWAEYVPGAAYAPPCG